MHHYELLKKSRLITEFRYIHPSNLKFAENRKSKFLFKYSFAAQFVAPGGCTTPTL
jgi:hypothetical protein